MQVQEVSGKQDDIIGIDALEDTALQAARQKIVDRLTAAFGQPGNGKYNINGGGAQGLADHLRDPLAAGGYSDFGSAAQHPGGEHHGLPETAFRIDPQFG